MAAFEALTALYTKATSEETSDARSAAAAELASGVEAAGVASIMSMALPAKVMASLGEAKNVAAREGAVLVCHALHTKLGLHFEPYMLLVLPALIERFDDKVKTVANAVDACLSAFVQAVNPASVAAADAAAGGTRGAEGAAREGGGAVPQGADKLRDSACCGEAGLAPKRPHRRRHGDSGDDPADQRAAKAADAPAHV